MSERRSSRCKKSKFSLIIASMLLIISLSALGTVAFLTSQSATVTNTFTPGTVIPGVEEDFDGSVKEDVVITNKGNVDVYVRAAIIVTWVSDEPDKDGNYAVLAEVPVAGTDYSFSGPDSGWAENGGYYYWNGKVVANGSTGVLIENCAPLVKAPVDGYSLSVEILTQTIQAEPTQAVKEAWGDTAAALVGATN